ncbi:MAG TPA: hypothetical protein VE987_11330 [Polyangiaceae bacterium]|nr:hypothetical protein [Polyangiaceae bacterium]
MAGALRTRSTAAALLWAVAVGGCGGPPTSQTVQDGVGAVAEATSPTAAMAPTPAPPSAACEAPAIGCPCAGEGTTAPCPGPRIHTGDYTSCAPGVRVCSQGSWGPCMAKTVYQAAGTLTEDYSSPCPRGSAVRWGAFALDGTIRDDAYVDVSVQTAPTASGLGGAPAVHLARFEGSAASSWTSVDVGSVLAAAGQDPGDWLRVSVELVASSSGGEPPALVGWRQASTCVPR